MPLIELRSADGHEFSAYRAEPEGTPRGAVVIAQEIFGVNAHIRSVADGFAAAGYSAIAPALFDRIERDVELGYGPDDFKRGRALVDRLAPSGDPGVESFKAFLADMQAAVDVATAVGKVAAIGYCLGGAITWVMAARTSGLACTVSYYGSRIAKFQDLHPQVPCLWHVGRRDASFPLEIVHAVAQRNPGVVLHEYDAGHGFNCDARPDYDAAAAAAARAHTLAFLAEHVG